MHQLNDIAFINFLSGMYIVLLVIPQPAEVIKSFKLLDLSCANKTLVSRQNLSL